MGDWERGGGSEGLISANNKQTHFRWPEIHFELSVDCIFTYCQVCFTGNFALETSLLFFFFLRVEGSLGIAKSPHKPQNFRQFEIHSDVYIDCLFT